MSTQFFLDESDIDTLINLLLRSQQSRTREALCLSIGIDPKRLSFIRDASESDFFLLLIRYLNEIDEKEALCKLCCKELLPVFHQGKYASILSEIAAKLNCNQRLSHNSPNNKQATVLSSISTSRIGVNPFNQLAQNKLIIGGAILLIGWLFIVKFNTTYTPKSTPPTITTPDTTNILGTVWTMKENGWDSVWQREGNTNEFKAFWTGGGRPFTSSITVTVNNYTEYTATITAERRDDASNNYTLCRYTGTLEKNTRKIRGFGKCGGLDSVWEVTIE